ncbi:uncharacterized protein LOC144085006 isoform X5 [Stigmatopora argus]
MFFYSCQDLVALRRRCEISITAVCQRTCNVPDDITRPPGSPWMRTLWSSTTNFVTRSCAKAEHWVPKGCRDAKATEVAGVTRVTLDPRLSPKSPVARDANFLGCRSKTDTEDRPRVTEGAGANPSCLQARGL